MTSVVSNVNGANTYAIQAALGAYSDEAYTNAKKLSGTGIVGPNPNINTSTETFIGQVRWYKPINPTINVASLTNSANGTGTTYSSDFSTYVKTVRTHGATQVNLQQVVTQQDGLAKISRDFGETRAQDEHNAILAVMRGVAISEALNGTCTSSAGTGLGGQTFTNDPTSLKYGFYVDMGQAAVLANGTNVQQGAARAEGFLSAIGKAWKDYEPDYAYLVCSPETIASLRSANLVDQTKVTEANVEFQTIFGGKFRLIQTRASQGFSTAELAKINSGAGSTEIAGTKTSFVVLPGAIAMEALAVPTPVEIYRDARAYAGGGSTDIWYRWGYVAHPGGYDWVGASTKFPGDTAYQCIVDSAESGYGTSDEGVVQTANVGAGVPQTLAGYATSTSNGVGDIATTVRGTWLRKTASALTLGILPIFHS